MLRAFVAARLADFCADAANTVREVRVARHYARGRGADRRAGAIQLDAACHHFHILLMQAFRRAMLAGDRAVVTGVDTALILFVWHIRLVIGPAGPDAADPSSRRRAARQCGLCACG